MQEQQEALEPEVSPEILDAAVEQDQVIEPEIAATEKEKEPAVAEFTPDFSYKFKGETREIPEYLRPLIKDEDTQKQIRNMVERAEAVELHKGKTSELESQLQEIVPMANTLKEFQEAYQTAQSPAEHHELLNTVGYSDEMIKDVAREILKREQLPEDQRHLMQENKRVALEKRQLMNQNEQIAAQYNQALTRITQTEIGLELGKAEYNPLISAYEKTQGEGSFEKLFLERGSYYTDLNGGTLVPPTEVMSRIAKEFAPFLTAAPVGELAGKQPAQVVTTKQKTMPNIGSGNGSPAKSAINSLEDLAARRKQLLGDTE